MNQIGAQCQIDRTFIPIMVRLMMGRKIVLHVFGCSLLSFFLAACSSVNSDVGQKDSSELRQGDSIARSKYESGLPSTEFNSGEDAPEGEAENLVAEQEYAQETGSSEHFNGQPASLSVTPVVLLEHSYTIRLGLFEESQEASEFVATHQLVADEAGIAEVTIDGARKFLLAYGVYSDKSDAISVADQLSQRLSGLMQVMSLAEVEMISVPYDDVQ